MTDMEMTAWLLEDADRCAGVVADAYSGWDTDKPWRDTLEAEIKHQRSTANQSGEQK